MQIQLNLTKQKFNFKEQLRKASKKPKLGWNSPFREYLQDIEICTNEKITPKQLERLKYALEHNSYRRLSSSENKSHRAKYRIKKKQIIEDWETNNGKKWKRYKEPVYSKKGNVVRNVGDLYDFHHIIPSCYEGDNEWWNGVPAKNPDEHQQGIHRKNGMYNKIFV